MKHKLVRLALGVGASLSVVAVASADADPARPPLPGAPTARTLATPGTPGTASSATLPVLVSEPEAVAHWRTHRTHHFTVLYCGEPHPALSHAELLEEAHRRFHEAFGDAPFALEPAREPLVALFFEEKADYLRYARETDRVDMSWTLAYYSAKTNRTAFFRYGRHGAEPTRVTDSDSTSALHEPAEATSAFRPLDPHLALASATHEAAHQLAFNTGLQQRGVIYPLWASEGLATNFELTAADGQFGPDTDNASRSARLYRAARETGLMTLDDFVGITRVPTDNARATDEIYAQAWGLFRFLYLHRREGLALYLAAMREAPHGHRPAGDLQDDFVAAFGATETLERDWLDWVASLPGD